MELGRAPCSLTLAPLTWGGGQRQGKEKATFALLLAADIAAFLGW